MSVDTSFYRQHLERTILPFWLSRAPDRTYGGVFTCFSNDGSQLLSDDKFVWSQGRYLWLLARTARLARQGLVTVDEADITQLADDSYTFLAKHAFLENGNCVYLLTKTGEHKEFLAGQGHDISFFADCFVLLGFAEYARLTGNSSLFDVCMAQYERIKLRLARLPVRSEPYPIPAGCQAHSFPMIMLNVAQELEECAEALGHSAQTTLKTDALAFMRTIMTVFRLPDGTIMEIVGTCDKPLLKQHLTPGHAIESMWFVLHEAMKHGEVTLQTQAIETIKVMFNTGWDDAYGGLLRFCFKGGVEPTGTPGTTFEQLILDTWDTKIWWTHSEAIYALSLAHALTGDADIKDMLTRVHDYTFTTFPNPDTRTGEWIQIRDRHGQPLDKLVGLPVKDPYHIYRNLLLLLELPQRLTMRA